MGLELNPSKYAVWRPAGRPPLPAPQQAWWVDALPCMGSHLHWVRTDADPDNPRHRDTAVGASELPESVDASVASLRALSTRLAALGAHGLPLQYRFHLLRLWVNGAVTHKQRARRGTEGQWGSFDTAVLVALGDMLGRDLPADVATLAFLPARLNGLGFLSAVARADAAFLASWEACVPTLRLELGLPTEAAVLQALPATAAALEACRASLRARGAPVHARRESGRQAQLMRPVVARAAAAAARDRPPVPTALLLEHGGPQGRAVLTPPRRPEHDLSTGEWAVTLRRRLLCPDPAGRAGLPCGHRSLGAGGSICRVTPPGPDFGVHSI